MTSLNGIENMVPSNQKNKDQRVLLRLFFEVHKHLLVILNLLKVRESWVVWNVSICSNWRLEYVIPKTNSWNLGRYACKRVQKSTYKSGILFRSSPHCLGSIRPLQPKAKLEVFILHKALGSLRRSHLSINFGGLRGGGDMLGCQNVMIFFFHSLDSRLYCKWNA